MLHQLSAVLGRLPNFFAITHADGLMISKAHVARLRLGGNHFWRHGGKACPTTCPLNFIEQSCEHD
jgi:hypothetical protein